LRERLPALAPEAHRVPVGALLTLAVLVLPLLRRRDGERKNRGASYVAKFGVLAHVSDDDDLVHFVSCEAAFASSMSARTSRSSSPSAAPRSTAATHTRLRSAASRAWSPERDRRKNAARESASSHHRSVSRLSATKGSSSAELFSGREAGFCALASTIAGSSACAISSCV